MIMREAEILISEHQSCNDALDDLLDYRQLYPGRRFELPPSDGWPGSSWRVILRTRRCRPWQRWSVVKQKRTPGELPWDWEFH